MRHSFEDGSYIDMYISGPGKVAIILGARDSKNPLQIKVNSVELKFEDLGNLIKDLKIDILK